MLYQQDPNTGAFHPVGAVQPWAGAVQPWAGGPLSAIRERWQENRQDRQDNRRADRVQKLLPEGMVLLPQEDVDGMLQQLEHYKAQYQKQLSGALAPMKLQGGTPQMNMAMFAGTGGSQGLSIAAGAPFAGNAAVTTAQATSTYPFLIKRYRLRAVGASGFGVSVSAISSGQSQLINGGAIVVGSEQPEYVVDLGTPIAIQPGVPVIVTYAGGTGVGGATGNFSLILEP